MAGLKTIQVLFIAGGGDDGYEVDKLLVSSLKASLGKAYQINYPEMKSDESQPDFGWINQIGEEVSKYDSDLILVGHSLGASMILKYLSTKTQRSKIIGIFLIATPFWEGDEDWKKGLKLTEHFADKLPANVPLFLYHSEDDQEAPFSQLQKYREKLSWASFHVAKHGGHQFNNDLTLVANDIHAIVKM